MLDDSEGTLGLGAPEVSIVRRLDRSGEGEYRLAGARCRLVDVIEVLSDTGLGKEMHSVISQGRVESIVTSKPRDRRMLIEEAAGLGKHRKRRRRAQLKLARTQDNLDRALDVEREARSRLRPLKRQAEAAELHARIERQTLEARWELARDDLRSHQAELAAAQAAAAAGARAGASRSSASSTAVAGPPRGGRGGAGPRAAPSARSCRGAASWPSPRASASRYRADAVARGGAGRRGAPARRPRAPRAALERGRAGRRARPGGRRADRRARAGAGPARARPRGRAGAPARRARGRARRAPGRPSASGPTAVEQAQAAREQARERLEQAARRAARGRARRSRPRGARRRGSAASSPPCNQFLRSQTAAPGGATVLADQLEVDPGYELARRRRARRAAARRGARATAAAAGALLDRAGADGGRALIARSDGMAHAPAEHARPRRTPSAEPLAEHVHGPADAAALARAPAPATCGWSRASSSCPTAFDGVAVTRAGRVWSSRDARAPPGAGGRRGARAGRAQPPRRAGPRERGRRAGRARRRAPRSSAPARRWRAAEAESRAGDRRAPRRGQPARRGDRARSGGSRRRSSGGGRRPTTARTPAAGCS